MNVRPFIPKDSQELPDAFGCKIHFVTGKVEEFELAQHRLNETANLMEFVTKDDEWHWVPLSSVAYVKFDKRMSKILEVQEKLKKEKLVQAPDKPTGPSPVRKM